MISTKAIAIGAGGLAAAVIGYALVTSSKSSTSKPGKVTPGPQPIATSGHPTVTMQALFDEWGYSVVDPKGDPKNLAIPLTVPGFLLTNGDGVSTSDPNYLGNFFDFYFGTVADKHKVFIAPDFAAHDPEIRWVAVDAAPTNWLEIV